MADRDDLIQKFLKRPQEVRFEEVHRLLKAFGYQLKKRSGSHRTYHKKGHQPITVPTVQGRLVKGIYIKKIIDFLDLEEYGENDS